MSRKFHQVPKLEFGGQFELIQSSYSMEFRMSGYICMQCWYSTLSSSVKNEQSPSNYKMPLDTVLCLDTSGSMGWNNNEGINQLKAAARKFLDGVEETARQADLKVGGVKPHQCYVPA